MVMVTYSSCSGRRTNVTRCLGDRDSGSLALSSSKKNKRTARHSLAAGDAPFGRTVEARPMYIIAWDDIAVGGSPISGLQRKC